MTHREVERRFYLVGTQDADELDALMRKVRMRMQLDGLHNVQFRVEWLSTGDSELIALGERNG